MGLESEKKCSCPQRSVVLICVCAGVILPERRQPPTSLHSPPADLHMKTLCSRSPGQHHEISLETKSVSGQISLSSSSSSRCSDLHVVLLTDDLSVSPDQTRTDCRNRPTGPRSTSITHYHVKAEGEHLVILENRNCVSLDQGYGEVELPGCGSGLWRGGATWLWVKHE